MKTLVDYTASKHNCYDFLRLLAASYVIFAHCFDLTLTTNPLTNALYHFRNNLNPGVVVFFIISGFLITESYDRRDNAYQFMKCRMLRIFPALIASILFTVFIIGSLATNYSLLSYLKSPIIYSFIKHNISLINITYTLPGVFTNNPYPNAVNGCLWTLPVEFTMYLVVCFLGLWHCFKYKIASCCAYLLIAALFYWIYKNSPGVLFNLPDFLCVVPFVVGSLFYVFKDYIYLNALVAAILLLCSLFINIPSVVFTLCFTYSVFTIAYLLPNCGKFITKYGDYSYGLYIFGFPIQQYILHLYPHISNINLFFSAFPCTFMLAIASWHMIEKPALSLKNKKIRLPRFLSLTRDTV